jgi:hypothetical protein
MMRRVLIGALLATLSGWSLAQPGPVGGAAGMQTPVLGPVGAGAGLGGAGPAATGGPSLDLAFAATGTLDPRITFTRASGATYFDVTGTMQTAATNVPRFDYDPVTHAAKGLLIEEQRINLLLNSTALSTQSITVAAVANTLSFYGTGTVALSGTCAGTLVGAGAFPARAALTFTPTAGTCTATVTGSVLDAQIEAGAFATSYITTAGAAATRAADVATMATGPWFNPAQGTMVVEATSSPGTSAGIFAQLDNGTTANRLVAYQSGAGPAIAAYAASGGTQILLYSPIATVAAGVTFKVGMSLRAGQQLVVMNGAAPLVSASALNPVGITELLLGNNGGTWMNGTLSRVRYWPRVLSGGELQAATQ